MPPSRSLVLRSTFNSGGVYFRSILGSTAVPAVSSLPFLISPFVSLYPDSRGATLYFLIPTSRRFLSSSSPFFPFFVDSPLIKSRPALPISLLGTSFYAGVFEISPLFLANFDHQLPLSSPSFYDFGPQDREAVIQLVSPQLSPFLLSPQVEDLVSVQSLGLVPGSYLSFGFFSSSSSSSLLGQ